MKAVVLAAGKGTRLRPLTDEIPKVMIPIAGTPILEHHIERLACVGIRDIFINLHYLPDKITSHFGDGEKWGVRIHYSLEPEILGTAGAVKKLAAELGGAPFLVVYGDNFSVFEYGDFMARSEKNGGLGTIAVLEKEDITGSGVVDIGPDGRIARFLEKPEPKEGLSHWVNAGIYRLSGDILDAIPHGCSDFGHDVFPEAIRRGLALYAYKTKEPVWAIDNLELWRELNARLGT